jgi:RNA polymerase sigma-70 factor (ECF subfamily)
MAKPSSGPSDQALVERIRAGDEDAFGTLSRRYDAVIANRVRRLLPAAVCRRVSAADVLQEVYVVAFNRFSDFEYRGEGSFRNWLMRIADLKVRKAIQVYAGTAKRAVGREVSRGRRADTAAFAGRRTSPSEAAIGHEMADHAREAMATLPDDYRTVLRLAIEERLLLREIAERMGRSREAVKKLYARALSRFTEAFEMLTGEKHG